jgi:hypothetical protein
MPEKLRISETKYLGPVGESLGTQLEPSWFSLRIRAISHEQNLVLV